MTNKGTLFLKNAQLLITHPDGTVARIALAKDIVRVGREKSNQFVTPAEFKSISRKHFEIRRKGSEFLLLDLGSDNGTRLNGAVITEAKLKDGDEIKIGMAEHGHELSIRFQAGSESIISGGTTSTTSIRPPASLSTDAPGGVPYLHIRFPKGDTSFFPIENDLTVVGRSTDADLVLPRGYGFISLQHFEIYRMGENFLITDLNSTNGTLLNNQPLLPNKPADLRTDDVVRIGDKSFGISIEMTFHLSLDA